MDPHPDHTVAVLAHEEVPPPRATGIGDSLGPKAVTDRLEALALVLVRKRTLIELDSRAEARVVSS
jgi:hypothetical protein